MGKDGLKRVSNRRDDALSRTRWDRLESLLADHYRAQGYRVDHVGTGGTGHRFDGGIDLKLYKDDQFTIVQCKGWNAYKVPHNDVHQLLGLMVNESANGAILVTSGEFTKAAIEAAAKLGHVQLVDGDELRQMLGPLPDLDAPEAQVDSRAPNASSRGFKGIAGAFASETGGRLLNAAEDRIRHGRGGRRSGGGIVRNLVIAKLLGAAIGFAALLLALYIMVNAIKGIATPTQRAARSAQVTQPQSSAGATTFGGQRVSAQNLPAGAAPALTPTEAEIRESQRKADEAMKVLEANTPEM